MSNATTLVTFLLQAPTSVYSVELLGSWDQFSKPYGLSRDKRVGRHHWSGCHKFENITCDGDLTDLSLKRDGALKMGGTYWYYYRLNGDLDYHDPSEPFTSTCPSLPGQTVNVLEVPVQTRRRKISNANSSATSLDSAVFTLDPSDKYLPLGVRRAATTSALPSRKTPMHEHETELDDKEAEPSCVGLETDPDSAHPTSSHRSLQSAFQRLRRTKTSYSSHKGDSAVRSQSSWSRKLISRAKSSRKPKHEVPVPDVPQIPDAWRKGELGAQDSQPLQPQAPASPNVHHDSPPSRHVQPEDVVVDPVGSRPGSLQSIRQTLSSVASKRSSWRKSFLSQREPEQIEVSHAVPDSVAPEALAPSSTIDEAVARTGFHSGAATPTEPTDEDTPREIQRNFVAVSPSDECSPSSGADHSAYAESSAISSVPSESFSPELTVNTGTSRRMSSIMLSQPGTPQTTCFDDNDTGAWQRRSDPDLEPAYTLQPAIPDDLAHLQPGPHDSPIEDPSTSLGRFQGYSLPLHEQASMVTIKKPPSHHDRPSLPRQTSTQLVQSWDDGAQHRLAGLSDMMDDLGYLGTLIN